MKKIETDADVLDWAKWIVDAKGEKFTPLSKGEQYAIARYVVGSAGCGSHDEGDEPSDSGWTDEADNPIPPNLSECASVTEDRSEEQKERMRATRVELFHRDGLDAQQAFDRYLSWLQDHPREKTVMDFSTGRLIDGAGFAYWLCSEAEEK